MPIIGLNHAVLSVRSVALSTEFYRSVLGFAVIPGTPRALGANAVFLRAPGSTNDHDLALFQTEAGSEQGDDSAAPGLVHLAWEVDTLAELERLAGALGDLGVLSQARDHGTTKSIYGHDPDGHGFEVVWIVPADRLDDQALASRTRIRRLNLDREKERYGAATQGGIGVSRGGPSTRTKET